MDLLLLFLPLWNSYFGKIFNLSILHLDGIDDPTQIIYHINT